MPTQSRCSINNCWMNEWLSGLSFFSYYFAIPFKEIGASWTDTSQAPFWEKATFIDIGCFLVARIKGEKNRSRVTEVWAHFFYEWSASLHPPRQSIESELVATEYRISSHWSQRRQGQSGRQKQGSQTCRAPERKSTGLLLVLAATFYVPKLT